MSKKNYIKIVFTFIGTFIGAGFASGREISLFFGGKSIFVPILSSLVCGGLSLVFMELGRITKGELVKAIFPKTYKAWEYLLCAANFIIFAAMLAGSEYVIHSAAGFVGGGILSGLLTAVIVLGGVEKIKAANLAAVPLIIVMIAIILFMEPKYNVSGTFSVTSPVLYASMNILSCGLLSAKLSHNNTKKQSYLAAVMITIILMFLIVAVYLEVNGLENKPMPLLDVAKSHGLGFAGSLLIYLAIITTMVGSLSLASHDKPMPTLILLAAGYLVSLFGFETIVNTAYPAIGVLGIALSVVAVAKLIVLKSQKGKTAVEINVGR